MIISSKDDEARDRLFDRVFRGELTPTLAEAEAERLSLTPLRPVPNVSDYNPSTKADWTLAMVVAWISSRNIDVVRDWWDEFRLEHWDWHYHEKLRIPVNGGSESEQVTGYELRQRRPASLLSLMLYEAVGDGPSQHIVSVKDARRQLWEALADGKLIASAEKGSDGGAIVEIPTYEWSRLEINGTIHLSDELRFTNLVMSVAYRNVLLRRSQVMENWPENTRVEAVSGAPGRPSSMHVVLNEFRRRSENGDALSTNTAEAEHLSRWLSENHPTSPPVKPKSVRNKLGGLRRTT